VPAVRAVGRRCGPDRANVFYAVLLVSLTVFDGVSNGPTFAPDQSGQWLLTVSATR